ncbi:MAG: NADPH-dependent FMN reductase [Bacteroidota bacterium]
MSQISSIAVVSTTSRVDSTTAQIVAHYRDMLERNYGCSSELLDLKELPLDFLNAVLYQKDRNSHPEWAHWQSKVNAADKFVFVIPEYNGSFPGILKCFVDSLQFPQSLRGKKASMIGISDGTQGAALAMSHFGDVLNYAGVTTLALRPRFIEVNKHWDGQRFSNPIYQNLFEEHVKQTVEM